MNDEYNNYLLQMKRLKASLPYMSEKDFCEANNLKYGEDEIKVFVARKSHSAKEVKPTLEAHINIKPPKEKRSYQYASTEEERKIARTQSTKKQREEWKEAGLTSKGKPFKK